MLSQERKVFKQSFSQVKPRSFVGRCSCQQNLPFLEKRLEITETTEGLLFGLQMLFHFFHLSLYFLFGLALILRHVFYLDFKCNILGFDGATVLSFLQISLVRKGPSQDLDSALIKGDIERILLHFEGVLVIDDGIECIYQCYWWQFGGLDAILEGGLLCESGIDGCLDHLQEDETFTPVFYPLEFGLQFFQLVLVSQDEDL